MSWITTLIILLLVISLVATAITEPALTQKFGKAYVTSGIKIIKEIVDFVKQISANVHNANNVSQQANVTDTNST